MSFFFTADTHFGHENIVQHCLRPFSDAQDMDKTMVERWNNVVTSRDTVYHLGDLAFHYNRKRVEALVDSLNGQIHLIVGNHDHTSTRKARNLEWVGHYKTLKFLRSAYAFMEPLALQDSVEIVLFHFPLRTWNKSHFGSWHLHGHHHDALPEVPGALSFDVGVDAWDFAPLSLETVYNKMMAIEQLNPNPRLLERGDRGSN